MPDLAIQQHLIGGVPASVQAAVADTCAADQDLILHRVQADFGERMSSGQLDAEPRVLLRLPALKRYQPEYRSD